MATPTEALARLQANPKNFLESYYVKNVRAMHQSGPAQFWFGGTGLVDLQGKTIYDRTPRPGSVLGNLHKHNSKNFKFTQHQAELVGDPVQVMAWHVDVVPSAGLGLGAIPALPVSRNGGPSLVLTTLLNGCTFVCEPLAHSVLMAHIQPTGGTNAAQLEQDVTNLGALAGGAGVAAKTTFGGGISYTAADNDVTIIGVREGTQWRLFAQIHPRNQRHTSRVDEFFAG